MFVIACRAPAQGEHVYSGNIRRSRAVGSRFQNSLLATPTVTIQCPAKRNMKLVGSLENVTNIVADIVGRNDPRSSRQKGGQRSQTRAHLGTYLVS